MCLGLLHHVGVLLASVLPGTSALHVDLRTGAFVEKCLCGVWIWGESGRWEIDEDEANEEGMGWGARKPEC